MRREWAKSVHKSKHHGIIIVDTSALLLLSAPINKKFLKMPLKKNGHVPRYADLIDFLSRHGYEILIPEMVAYEAARVIRDGSQVEDRYWIPQMNECRPLFQHARSLFLEIDRAKKESFSIRHPEENATSNAADFIRKTWQATRQPTPQKIMEALEKTRAEHPDKKNYGDIAARELAHTIPEGIRIFYLCQDKKASDEMIKIKRQPPIGRLNVTGLLMALDNADLLAKAGLHHVKSAHEVVQAMNEDIKEMCRKAGISKGNLVSNYFIDSTRPKDRKNDRPFFARMKDLATEIGLYGR